MVVGDVATITIMNNIFIKEIDVFDVNDASKTFDGAFVEVFCYFATIVGRSSFAVVEKFGLPAEMKDEVFDFGMNIQIVEDFEESFNSFLDGEVVFLIVVGDVDS